VTPAAFMTAALLEAARQRVDAAARGTDASELHAARGAWLREMSRPWRPDSALWARALEVHQGLGE
jgi:hypothetical protein